MNTNNRYLPNCIPCGVCDDRGAVGAVERGDGTLDLLNLWDGGVTANLAAPRHALFMDGTDLFGWSPDRESPNVLHLTTHRVTGGVPDAQGAVSLDLPAWVNLNDAASPLVTVKAVKTDDGFTIWWRAKDRYAGGAPPPDFMLDEIEARTAHGRVDVDARAQTVLLCNDEDGFTDDGDPAKEGAELAVEIGARVYSSHGELRNAPWHTPTGKHVLIGGEYSPKPTGPLSIGLLSAPSAAGAAIPRRELGFVDDPNTPPELSLDGRFIAAPANREGDEWSVVAVDTGIEAGVIFPETTPRQLQVIGDRALWLEEHTAPQDGGGATQIARTLVAVSLPAGDPLWRHEIQTKIVDNLLFLPYDAV